MLDSRQASACTAPDYVPMSLLPHSPGHACVCDLQWCRVIATMRRCKVWEARARNGSQVASTKLQDCTCVGQLTMALRFHLCRRDLGAIFRLCFPIFAGVHGVHHREPLQHRQGQQVVSQEAFESLAPAGNLHRMLAAALHKHDTNCAASCSATSAP